MDAQSMTARLAACGIDADDALSEKLLRYHALLMDWNTRMDLTAVSDEDEMLDRHYADSLSVLAVDGMLPTRGSLIDVGTGAGFPGLPLAIACPELSVTLLDSQQKRLNFLAKVIEELALTNVTLVHARAEDGARKPELREAFDAAVARAVAPLPVLAEYLLPYVKVGGKAICWKGPAVMDEMTRGARACRVLGGTLGEPVSVTFPQRDWQHVLLPIAKHAATGKLFPRKAGTPGKLPLGGEESTQG